MDSKIDSRQLHLPSQEMSLLASIAELRVTLNNLCKSSPYNRRVEIGEVRLLYEALNELEWRRNAPAHSGKGV